MHLLFTLISPSHCFWRMELDWAFGFYILHRMDFMLPVAGPP